MGYTRTGLPNNGSTQFFNFQYDASLTPANGLGLATDMMQHCDNDLALLAAWFSGRQLDMSPPINVSVNTVATDASGSPTQFVGGHWEGALTDSLQVTINIGELPMLVGTATMLARYLLVSEVSEMYMRAFNAQGPNPWFRSFDEGNKGEALSRFLATQFLLHAFPGVTSVPTLTVGAWNVTNLWLNSARKNFLEVNDDDTNPDEEVGCATLFLFYLRDQRGYAIPDIINAGGGHLSNVYENLTHDSAMNAWGKFSGLVNPHYPSTPDPSGTTFTPSYNPPLETVFPVSDLTLFTAPVQISWVASAMPSSVAIGLNHSASVPLPITISSSHPEIIPPPSVTILPPSASAVAALTVVPQPAGFHSTVVALTASYAGRSLTRNVVVVRPDAMGLPPLEIDVDRSADPCQVVFVEGTSQTFVIANLNVFVDQATLSFSWSVSSSVGGVTAGPTNQPNLTISILPGTGATVTVQVTVTNAEGLQAAGTLTFQTVATPTGLQVLSQELWCRLGSFRNGSLSIPPWVPIELEAGPLQERLVSLEEQIQETSRLANQVTAVIRSMMDIAPSFGGAPRKDTPICIRIRVLNSLHQPLGGTVNIEFQPQDAGEIVKVKAADASKNIDVLGLQRYPQVQLYEVTVTPTDVFKPTSQFVKIPPSGFDTVEFVIG